MAGDQTYVSIWKTSAEGRGERHVAEGYPTDEFPGRDGHRPDGCAYFAKDRWIAELFAGRPGYEEFLIEVQVPIEVYRYRFQQFEHVVVFGAGRGVELAIPAEHLDELNRVGVRFKRNPLEDSTS